MLCVSTFFSLVPIYFKQLYKLCPISSCTVSSNSLMYNVCNALLALHRIPLSQGILPCACHKVGYEQWRVLTVVTSLLAPFLTWSSNIWCHPLCFQCVSKKSAVLIKRLITLIMGHAHICSRGQEGSQLHKIHALSYPITWSTDLLSDGYG